MVEHVLDTFTQVNFGQRIIVIGGVHQEDLITLLQAWPTWDICINARAAEGMGTSIAVGAKMLREAAGVFVCPADMPRIQPSDVDATADLFDGPTSICRPMFRGKPGHPVLFGRAHFARLQELRGDEGGAAILRNSPSLMTFNATNPGVVADIDHPQTLL